MALMKVDSVDVANVSGDFNSGKIASQLGEAVKNLSSNPDFIDTRELASAIKNVGGNSITLPSADVGQVSSQQTAFAAKENNRGYTV